MSGSNAGSRIKQWIWEKNQETLATSVRGRGSAGPPYRVAVQGTQRQQKRFSSHSSLRPLNILPNHQQLPSSLNDNIPQHSKTKNNLLVTSRNITVLHPCHQTAMEKTTTLKAKNPSLSTSKWSEGTRDFGAPIGHSEEFFRKNSLRGNWWRKKQLVAVILKLCFF